MGRGLERERYGRYGGRRLCAVLIFSSGRLQGFCEHACWQKSFLVMLRLTSSGHAPLSWLLVAKFHLLHFPLNIPTLTLECPGVQKFLPIIGATGDRWAGCRRYPWFWDADQKYASDPRPPTYKEKIWTNIWTKYGPKCFKTRQIRQFGGHIFVQMFCLHVGVGVAKRIPSGCPWPEGRSWKISYKKDLVCFCFDPYCLPSTGCPNSQPLWRELT